MLPEENLKAEEIEKEFLERLDEIIQQSDRDWEKIKRLGSCECEEIVESVFVPLARHCMAMGEYTRGLYYLLECAAAYLHLSNNYMAFCNLNTAENLIKSVDFRATVINQFEEATFYSLKGEVRRQQDIEEPLHVSGWGHLWKMIAGFLCLPPMSIQPHPKLKVQTTGWARMPHLP
nr:adenylate cyclase type 10-like [Chrysemys picta bellii]